MENKDTVFGQEEQADQSMLQETLEDDELMMESSKVLMGGSPGGVGKKSRTVGGLAVNIASRAIMVMAMMCAALPAGPGTERSPESCWIRTWWRPAERENESSWRSSTCSTA